MSMITTRAGRLRQQEQSTTNADLPSEAAVQPIMPLIPIAIRPLGVRGKRGRPSRRQLEMTRHLESGMDFDSSDFANVVELSSSSSVSTSAALTLHGGTRCVCGREEDDGLMVQCDGCTYWMHSGCLGLGHTPKAIPSTFFCPPCSGLPPPFLPVHPPPLIANLIGWASSPNHDTCSSRKHEFQTMMQSTEISPTAFADANDSEDGIDKVYAYCKRPEAEPYYAPDEQEPQRQYMMLSTMLHDVQSHFPAVDSLRSSLADQQDYYNLQDCEQRVQYFQTQLTRLRHQFS